MALIDIKTKLQDDLDNFEPKKFYDDCENVIEGLLEENHRLLEENKKLNADIEKYQTNPKEYVHDLILKLQNNRDKIKANKLEISKIQRAIYKNNSTSMKTIVHLQTIINSNDKPSIRTSRERHRNF